MSDDKILKFERSKTALEIARNEHEDDNIAFMAITMVTKDGDYLILDSGEELDFMAISYFAEYFEQIRKSILQDMFNSDELLDTPLGTSH